MRSALLTLALLATGCADSADDTVVVRDTDVTVAPGTDTPADGVEPIADGDALNGDAADGAQASATPDVAASAPATPAASAAKAGDDDDGAAVARAGTGRAATKTVTLMAEGDSYSQAVKLAAFPDFPAPFSTYVHDDMTVEQPGSGDAASLEWGAGRVLVDWARDGSVAETIERVQANTPGATPQQVSWARAAFSYIQNDAVGTVYVVEKDGTVVTIESSSSTEGAEGAVNVDDVVLGEWQWADGTPLR